MKLDILQVPDCPNVAVLEQRLHEATAGRPITPEITHHIIDDPEQAASTGMTGSPTLLIDGRDRLVSDPDRDMRIAWGSEAMGFS